MPEIRVGDYVKLSGRERPHHHSAGWWEVVMVHETCLDARRWISGQVADRRFGVCFTSVLGHRKANEPE